MEQNSPPEISSTDYRVMNSMASKLSLPASANSILIELESIIYTISQAIRKLLTLKIQSLEHALTSWSSALTGSINNIVTILEYHIVISQRLFKQVSILFLSLKNLRIKYASFIRPHLIVDWRFWFLYSSL